MRRQSNFVKERKAREQPFSFSDSTNSSFTRITRNTKINFPLLAESSKESLENNEKDKNTNNRLRRMKKLIGCAPTESEEKRLNGEVKSESQTCLETKAKYDCCICLGEVNLEEGHLDCSHFFCFTCIKNWSNYTNTCPLCKKEYFEIKRRLNDLVMESFKIEPKIFVMEEEDDDDESDQSFDGTDENCYVCDHDNNHHLLLICDKCNFFICHTYCASPAIDRIPESEWFCSFCSPNPLNNNGNNNINSNNQIITNNNNNTPAQNINNMEKNKNERIMTRSSCVFGNFEYLELKNDYEMDIFAHRFFDNEDDQEDNLDENSNKENNKFYNLRNKRKKVFDDEEERDIQLKKRKLDCQYPLRSQRKFDF